MTDVKRVLAVGAHPDDLEFLCGGTLARFAKAGVEVTMCVCSNGDVGHTEIPQEKLGEVRLEECRKSAAIIGAKFIWLGCTDLRIHHDPQTMDRMADVVREAKPDLIIAHDPKDYMYDHIRAGELVVDGSFGATVPYFKTPRNLPHHPKIAPIYFMDTIAGVNFLPTEYVDITQVIETKRQMLAQHQSQISWLREHDNTEMDDLMLTQARFRGLQCGCQYAEGFRPHQVWGRLTTRRLLP